MVPSYGYELTCRSPKTLDQAERSIKHLKSIVGLNNTVHEIPVGLVG